MDKHRLVLILGGARSGKSAYAEELAMRIARAAEPTGSGTGNTISTDHTLIYVATAMAGDDSEMSERIARHQQARDHAWHTIEAPYEPAGALAAAGELGERRPVILLDCLTLLVSNLLLRSGASGKEPPGESQEDETGGIGLPAAEERVEAVIGAVLAHGRENARSLILVSNEVGMGLVPPYPLGRLYRDILGRVNAQIAGQADVVLLMLAGLPIEVKSLAGAWRAAATERLGLPG
jgi:adenosylcobinamide kinase / adenosylcobinamide-phosphate guanylyltransferase